MVAVLLATILLLVPSHNSISYVQPAEAQVEPIFVHVWGADKNADRVKIDALIVSKSREYGVSEATIRHIISRESTYISNSVGDKNYLCQKTGKISPSYGLVQISSCWHPYVSYQEATNPEFAIDFLAKNLAKGRCSMWSTCPLK